MRDEHKLAHYTKLHHFIDVAFVKCVKCSTLNFWTVLSFQMVGYAAVSHASQCESTFAHSCTQHIRCLVQRYAIFFNTPTVFHMHFYLFKRPHHWQSAVTTRKKAECKWGNLSRHSSLCSVSCVRALICSWKVGKRHNWNVVAWHVVFQLCFLGRQFDCSAVFCTSSQSTATKVTHLS